MDTMMMEQRTTSDEMLKRFAGRVGTYDRDNRFFQEDFDELKRAGYLTINVPKELGGLGLTLAEVCREQRRLAYRAPATALAINMHLYWMGVAADLWRAGDRSLEWVLKEAMAGEVFAAGHAERGNDLPVLLSTSKAERRSTAASASPATRCSAAWRRSGRASACTACGPMPRRPEDRPRLHAAQRQGLPHRRDLGHAGHARDAQRRRAARRRLRAGQVHRRGSCRPAGPTPSWSRCSPGRLMGFANIYYGMAQRALRPGGRGGQDEDLDGG